MPTNARFLIACCILTCTAALTAREPDAGAGSQADKLWNGWGMTPTGQIVPLSNLAAVTDGASDTAAAMSSDLPLRLAVTPDGKSLLAVCSGYNHTGLAVLSLAQRRVTHFFPLPEVFNGLAFSKDGKRLFLSGGDSGVLHVFTCEKGELVKAKPAKVAGKTGAFLAGIAVHPTSGKLYVCNEAGHEVWIVDPESLKHEATVSVEMHPHSCMFGTDRRHLYVSNWGSKSVSVIDTKEAQKVRDIGVGIRPNEMALAPDGRLFVACAGDNTST